MIAEEVIDDELPLFDVRGGARAAPPHLLVEDWAPHPTAQHEMQYFAAVEASIEHTDADCDHGVGFRLEPSDHRVRIGYV